jgi:hypothetical protein
VTHLSSSRPAGFRDDVLDPLCLLPLSVDFASLVARGSLRLLGLLLDLLLDLLPPPPPLLLLLLLPALQLSPLLLLPVAADAAGAAVWGWSTTDDDSETTPNVALMATTLPSPFSRPLRDMLQE